MKLLLFCTLFLGVFSCNIPQNNAALKPDAECQAETSSSSYDNKDSLKIELKQCCFSQRDTIVLQYNIKNTTHWQYTYLSDEYWIERQVDGDWIRMPNDFGSTLMGKAIPAHSSVNDSAKVLLEAGRYRFCNTAYSDDARIGNEEIVMWAEFEIRKQ